MAEQKKHLEDLKIMAILGALTDIEVSVGLHQEEGGHLVAGSDSTVAQIAYWNEYGTTKSPGQIPARPAYRQFAASDAIGQGADQFAESIKGTKDEGEIDIALQRFGEALAAGLWKHVDNFSLPPNAASTIKAKGRNDPLVDSGRTRDSISWAVSRRGTRIKKGMARG